MTDRAELLSQAGGSLKRVNLNAFFIQAGCNVVSYHFNAYTAMSQTLKRRIEQPYWIKFIKSIDLIVIDECFVAGTKIDYKNIEDIKIGDYVNSFNHHKNIVEKKRVLNTFKNPIRKNTIKITLSCNHLRSTQEHPIFVIGKGYINAKDVKKNDRVILYDLRKSNEKRKLCCKQAKDRTLRIERVQSVEIQERSYNKGCKGYNDGHYVYNIEVEDNNNYFANNILVHNCHKQEFNYLFESGLLEDKHVLGFTATPKRSGRMRQLALDYDNIIETVTVRDLIEQGYLVNDDYNGIASPNMSDVTFDSKTGDYKTSQVYQKFKTPQLYAGVVKNWLEICPNTKTLVFCVNIEHVINTCLEFKKHGITAKFLVSNASKPKEPSRDDLGKYARYEEKMKTYNLYTNNFKEFSGDRQQVLSDYTNGTFKVLVNAGILTTGYDEPSIETIVLNRATASVALLLQMLGRGSRIFDGKTHFNVLDFGGNCERLGFYSEARLWSLWHEKIDGEGLPPVKECGFNSEGKPTLSNGKKGCRRLIMASMNICPFCGYKYPDKSIKEINLESIMFDTNQKRAVKVKRIKDMSMQELHDYWKSKGHKTPWLWRQLWYKGGGKAVEKYGKEFNWSSATVRKALNFCEKF
jgi:superfamily II DNA or RNA helicase